MRIAVYLVLFGALALARILPPAARRLGPRAAARTLAGGLLGAGLIWIAAVGLLAAATIGRLAPVARLGCWSAGIMRADNPVPLPSGLAAVVALALTSAALSLAGVQLFRDLGQLRRLRSLGDPCAPAGLVVVDAAAPEAWAVPGRRSRVVVTSGMLRALDADGHRVLLAHEQAHLDGRHWLLRLAVRLGAALLPRSRPAVVACDLALERWADESAAEVVGSRRMVAAAVAAAALASTEHARRHCTVLPAFADGSVRTRVEALLAPRPRPPRGRLLWLPTGVATAALVMIVDAVGDCEQLFDLARHAWH